ncbi:hypothetical protein AXX17_AT5G22260 [Arabidopsis thaliana]|uniref:Uncharacterized protein n=1 Tax=Arabidopsis thaliana TaxID=3702 RepID=A0A178ULK9_ARATH|nr:hypothetical protein AXX17_AT5G22260 [Arabidopsis thaliana]
MLIKKYDMKDFKSVKPKEHIKLLKTQKLPLTSVDHNIENKLHECSSIDVRGGVVLEL